MTAVSLGNRIKVSTATTGTGTVTLGSAFSNAYCTFAEGGITNGQTVRYEIIDGTDFEIGTGVYTSSGTTMTRASVTLSKISGTSGTTKINLSGSASVAVVGAAEDIFYDGAANTSGKLTTGTIELGSASDTTIARSGAGAITVEGTQVLLSGAALGTPASGTLTNCTGLPVSGITASTSTALGVGSIELGNASDTTIARSGAGAVTVEGVQVILSGAALGTPASGTLTNCTGLPVAGITSSTSTALGVGSIELGHATDTTISRITSGLAAVEGVAVITGTTLPIPQNIGLSVSAAASALTIALKGANGSDASATNPIYLPFRSATGTTGTPVWRTLTAASSIVVSSGSTLGVVTSTPFRLWVVMFDDAATLRLGVINCLTGTSIFPLGSDNLVSSTAEGGAGAADSAGVFYTGTAVTSKPYCVLGYVEWDTGGVTAGTWTTSNLLKVQLFSHDVALPGKIIQTQNTQDGAAASGSTTIPDDNTIPQSTEGVQFMTTSITPTSAANLLRVSAQAQLSSSAAADPTATIALFQDAGTDALAAAQSMYASADFPVEVPLCYHKVAGTASSTTFKIRGGTPNTGTTRFNGWSGGGYGGVFSSHLRVEEIMR